jgi:hypothetical protein
VNVPSKGKTTCVNDNVKELLQCRCNERHKTLGYIETLNSGKWAEEFEEERGFYAISHLQIISRGEVKVVRQEKRKAKAGRIPESSKESPNP